MTVPLCLLPQCLSVVRISSFKATLATAPPNGRPRFYLVTPLRPSLQTRSHPEELRAGLQHVNLWGTQFSLHQPPPRLWSSFKCETAPNSEKVYWTGASFVSSALWCFNYNTWCSPHPHLQPHPYSVWARYPSVNAVRPEYWKLSANCLILTSELSTTCFMEDPPSFSILCKSKNRTISEVEDGIRGLVSVLGSPRQMVPVQGP